LSKPEVTLITPVYNGEISLPATITSVQNQSSTDWRWIIVDDGSTDQTSTLIAGLDDERISLIQTPRQGAPACRNLGLDRAQTDYVMFLDADDLLTRDCLAQRLNYVTARERLDFAVFNTEIIDATGLPQGINLNRRASSPENYADLFRAYCAPWQTSSPLWRTEFLHQNDFRFSLQYPRLQDIEFHTKILLSGKANFDYAEALPADTQYRLPDSTKKKPGKTQLNNMLDGMEQYWRDYHVADQSRISRDYAVNTLHTLLFHYELNREMAEILQNRPHYPGPAGTPLNKVLRRFFLSANVLGLTRRKGFGISRLWNYFTG